MVAVGDARDASARVAPPPAFVPVVEDCNVAVRALADETVLVAVRPRTGSVDITIARWDPVARALADIETVAVPEFESVAAIEVGGAGFASARVTLSGDSAPDLSAPGTPVITHQARLERSAGRWRLAGQPSWVRTTLYADGYTPPGEELDSLLVRWKQAHRSCRLASFVHRVPVPGGVLALAWGCPSPSPGATCAIGCLVVWQGPASGVREEPAAEEIDVVEVRGKGIIARRTEAGLQRLEVFDGSTQVVVPLPTHAAGERFDVFADPRGGVWLELAGRVHRAEMPVFAWKDMCSGGGRGMHAGGPPDGGAGALVLPDGRPSHESDRAEGVRRFLH